MDIKEKFINDFKTYLISLPSTQTGDFVRALNEQLNYPTEFFLHLLCRKVDIRHPAKVE